MLDVNLEGKSNNATLPLQLSRGDKSKFEQVVGFLKLQALMFPLALIIKDIT